MNRCYDHVRSPKNRPKVSLSARPGGEDGATSLGDRMESNEAAPEVRVEAGEVGAIVRKAVGELPEKERNVLVLRHYQGLKFREIAEVTGLTSRTVQNCLKRGREKLGRSLARAGLRPQEVT